MDMKRFEEAYINLHIVVENMAIDVIEDCTDSLEEAKDLESGIDSIAFDLRTASEKLYKLDSVLDKLDEFYSKACDELRYCF